MSVTAHVSQPTYYQILHLMQSDRPLDPVELKAAYRRALLLHHPDKGYHSSSATPKSVTQTSGHAYSIDQIAEAYKTLSCPIEKAEYDRLLSRCSRRLNTGPTVDQHTGADTYDLGDLAYTEETGNWARGCRCGDKKGYVLSESDLEKETENGEIYVGCEGCSLTIRVIFEAAEIGSDGETVPNHCEAALQRAR